MATAISAARPKLLVGTRKGAFSLQSEDDGKSWALQGPEFLGHIIYHIVADRRNSNVLLMAAKTGHLGPTIFRSVDGGTTWSEAVSPPSFPKVPEGENGKAVEATFWLTPGHHSEPGVWYTGTIPIGLFRSTDDGNTWEPVSGFNDAPDYDKWSVFSGTPGGQMVHQARPGSQASGALSAKAT